MYQISYAQNREDIIINSFFPDVERGFYIDIGANHPLYHSVTKLFYDKGWSGINYEPNPKLYDELCKYRKRDKNFLQAVGDEKDTLELRVYHSKDTLEGISTLSKEMKQTYSKYNNRDTNNYDDIKVPINTLSNLLSNTRVNHIHFMKIDVEGFEYEVLNGNDWNKYRPELICIESNHIMRDWKDILKKAKYRKVFNDGLNTYYLSQESMERLNYFDYVDLFLSDKVVINFDLSQKLELLKRLEKQNKALTKDLKLHQDEIKRLNELIVEITPLRKHIKRQVKSRVLKK